MTLLYDNAVTDNVFAHTTEQNGLSQQDSQAVMHQLGSSIDLHKLASIFYNQLKTYLKIDALTIEFPQGLLTIGDRQEGGHLKQLEQAVQHQPFATIKYAFSHGLSIRESGVLNDLHRLFKFPLKNALDFHTIKQLALRDHLTSLGNRANYTETLQRLTSLAKRNGETFGLLVIDMDRFKQVNDVFGHQEGDNVLVAMSEVLKNSLRDTDYAFRFGGDEFCCLLPGSENDTNALIAERIQSLMAADQTLTKHGISCSIGSANYQLGDAEQDIFRRADKALYHAKQSGRSCFKAA